MPVVVGTWRLLLAGLIESGEAQRQSPEKREVRDCALCELWLAYSTDSSTDAIDYSTEHTTPSRVDRRRSCRVVGRARCIVLPATRYDCGVWVEA